MQVKSKKAKGKIISASLRLCGLSALLAISVTAQWVKQTVDTTASLRGLSVVNEKVVWASGTGGTVIRTTDRGKTWKVMTVPGAEKLDFRDVEAFDANTAYILSIGNGEASRIYKTTDGGATWVEQFRNKNEKAFFDAIACWDKQHCLAMSDPVDNFFLIIHTDDGGKNWMIDDDSTGANTRSGEAAFAASGTCLIITRSYPAFIVSGGQEARVFRASPKPMHKFHWQAFDSPIVKGTAGSGIFSIAMYDGKNGVIVGGNYEKPGESKDNLAFTTDGGATWKPGIGLTGYRSGVTYIDKKTIIAVGTNGSDISLDGGKTWKKVGLWPVSEKVTSSKIFLVGTFPVDLNSVAAKGKKAVWAVGPNGAVVKLK